jgi:tRNA 2-thiouridine synthesizing protein A
VSPGQRPGTSPGPATEPQPIEVDARGLRCPLPVIRLAEAAREAPAGTLITVLASDPAARHDIPAWCRMRGHELSAITEEGEYLRFVVMIRDQRSKAGGAGSDSEPSSRAT